MVLGLIGHQGSPRSRDYLISLGTRLDIQGFRPDRLTLMAPWH